MDNGQLIDEVRDAMRLPSDYALCKEWDIPLSTMSAWRQGREVSDYFLIRAAEALDKDPRELIALRELAKHPHGQKKVYWETLLRKLFGVVSAGACIAGSLASSDITPNDTTPLHLNAPPRGMAPTAGPPNGAPRKIAMSDLANNYAQYVRVALERARQAARHITARLCRKWPAGSRARLHRQSSTA